MTYDYDVIVIGSGPGGYVAAIRAAQLGLKVACIDKRETLGGTCLNVGCIPSKALLQSTENYAWLKNAAKEQGIVAPEARLDFNVMMQRKDGIVKGLVDGISLLFKKHGITRLKGAARFVDPHTLEVVSSSDRQQVTGANIVIATGSTSISLPFLAIDEKRIVSSTGALAFKEPPKNLLVIGGGVIGVELASVYQRLGTKVTIIEMLDTLTPTMDEVISKLLLQTLKKQGIEFYLGAKVTGATQTEENIKLNIEHEQKSLELVADAVLVAVGRRPLAQELGLDTIALNLSQKGFIPVDANFRTTHKHIYAIGDVIEGPMLAHRATHEGIAVAELLAGKPAKVNYVSIPNVIYTHPEVAAVGLTEKEAQALGIKVKVGVNYFRGNPRARCAGEIEGLVKVVADEETGRIVGMHIIGAHASELIAEGMLALDKRATLQDIVHACHAHPTLSESIMEACQQALGCAIHE